MDILNDRSPFIVLTWNRDDAEEVKAAKRKFGEYLRKGWIAFAVVSGRRNVHVYEFDATFEKVILAPIVEGG